jgi:tetratricopeptide (TPR) repeat protein
MAGVARWLRQAGDLEGARTLFRRAVDQGLNGDLLFRTLWDLAQLERKLGAEDAAVQVWTDLAAERNPFRVRALEQLAKHWEHRGKNPAKALEATRAALAWEDSEPLRRREARLVRALGRATKPVRTRRGAASAR